MGEMSPPGDGGASPGIHLNISSYWLDSWVPAGGTVASPRRCSFIEVFKELVMIKVKLRGNETAEQMLRRFKKMCEKEGLTKDIKRIAYYEKPSGKRRARGKPQSRPIH